MKNKLHPGVAVVHGGSFHTFQHLAGSLVQTFSHGHLVVKDNPNSDQPLQEQNTLIYLKKYQNVSQMDKS